MISSQPPLLSPTPGLSSFWIHYCIWLIEISPGDPIADVLATSIEVNPTFGSGVRYWRYNFCFIFQSCKITDLFDMVRPHMDFTFHCLSSHVNTVYVLCTKPGVTSPRPGQPATPLKLKGEMILLPEVDSLLFVASPVVLNLHELNKKGNFSCSGVGKAFIF